MTELRNLERELRRFRGRLIAAGLFVVLAFGLLTARLVDLQVFRHDDLQVQAENNRITVVPIVPNRGLITDRNGIVLANNYSAYTLEITPSKLDRDIDEVIDSLAEIISVEPRDRRRFRKLLEDSKSFESLPIRTKLTEEEVARFTAQRFRFPGVEIKARLFRHYPFGALASHVLGYIGRINTAEQDVIDQESDEIQANYRGTDYIGKLGIEQSYEEQLHGLTGFEEVETNSTGRAVRRLKSSPATPGNTVKLSIDIKMQNLVEQLYGDRRGALVAIDPRSGEVLAFVSMPTFDPNLFVDGIDSDSWKDLNESIDKPLLDRALNGTYPPGSTFKPYMALAALQTGKRRPGDTIHDPGYFWFGNHKFNDDKHDGHGNVDMYRSIVQSCDTYYFMLANDLGIDNITQQMAPFGFGQITGIDIHGESKGVLPSKEWKAHAFRKPEQQRWFPGDTISLGIGQGFNSYTILQLANAVSTLSSGGKRFKPHLVKEVVNTVSGVATPVADQPLSPVDVKPENIEFVRHAMVGVNIEGTSANAFRGATYTSGGKTGTAQVVGLKANEKYVSSRVAERLRDHALFIAYAPADNPTIALALIVENDDFGAASAAPIARRVLDYWIAGLYPTPEDIAAVQQRKATAPIAPPVPVAQAASAQLAASAPEVAASRALPPMERAVAGVVGASGSRTVSDPASAPASGPAIAISPDHVMKPGAAVANLVARQKAASAAAAASAKRITRLPASSPAVRPNTAHPTSRAAAAEGLNKSLPPAPGASR